jgi:ubiquinone/menaquinone biosynthesis C-methylase UbiE
MNNSELTARMQQTWAAGDFNRVALGITEASQALVRAVDVRPGERVLDVACGSGNAALAASHRHAEVVGLDYVPALIERARKRAEAEGSTVDFRVGDAQALPFEDHAFDVVLSVFGVIFAPDQEGAMAELLRVTRPGGRIALATWMPEGMGGETFRAMSRHVPPPAGAKPVVRWGTEEGLREISGGAVTFQLTPRTFHQYYRSVDHMLDTFFQYFGPAVRAREAVGDAGYPALRRDLAEVFSRLNRATDFTAQVASDYLVVIATKP